MKKSLEEILQKIESNWTKRQGRVWRFRNELVYNFMKNLYSKGAPKIIPNPSIDNEDEPFSFYSYPNMQLGLPGEPYATRVDFDGQIDTLSGKYHLYLGDSIDPLNKRIWTLTDGYLPEINYNIIRDEVSYLFRMFQFWVEDGNMKVPVNFIQIDIDNDANKTKNISLYFGVIFSRFKIKPFAIRSTKFNKKWEYSFKESNKAFRDNKLIYLVSKDQEPTRLFSKLEIEEMTEIHNLESYEGVFSGKDKKIKKTIPVLLQEYKFPLAPKDKKTLIFKVPQDPIDLIHDSIIKKIEEANINTLRQKFKRFWEEIINQCSSILIPENKISDTHKASLIYNFMCQNFHKEGTIEQHVNRFQYNAFWIRDSSFYSKMYCLFNRPDISRRLLLHFLTKQDKKGNFCSQRGQYDGWGQTLWAFGEYIKLTKDKEFAEKIYSPMMKAISWLQITIKKDKWGIMPPRFAADNEMISGRYTGHNFWTWCGLNNAIYIADFLNKIDDKYRIEQLKSEFLNSFLPILKKICEKHNDRVPPGLDTDIGEDWSNLLMIYPQKLLELDDPKIKTTLQDYREKKMPEGIAMWMVFLHHYITERIAQQYLLLDDQKLVLRDFYSMLSHTGACHEGFEHNIKPWGDRNYIIPIRIGPIKLDYYNFPPHGWFAVAYNLLLRNMLIREEDDNLHLFSVISPEWINGPIQVKNANTYFGVCDLELINKDGQLILNFKSDFVRFKPKKIIIHIPYFIDKATLSLESKIDFQMNENKTYFTLEPKEEFSINIKWEINQQVDLSYLSYEKAVQWLKNEYKKRYLEQVKRNTLK